MAEQVIIEFISDTSGLDSANDRLEEQGKITHQNGEEFKKTNAEMIKQQKALEQIGSITKKIDESGKVTRRNLADIAKIIKSQSTEFQTQLKKGIIESLKQAGASVEEFTVLLENAISPTVKQQLRALTEELAKMKVEGKDNTEQYKALAAEAGRLKDAINDANQEVKNFGSDTSTFDGLLGLTQGITGGFAVLQGATALFGDESEELQKTLLRVNAAMAILQGLQQIQITLQKESAAATLADTIVTKARTAAQVLFNFVIGSSTGLLKAFRIALAATGVGLLVIGIIELVSALKSSNDELEKANFLIDSQKSRIESLNQLIERRTSIEEARARLNNELESEIIKIQGRSLLAQREALEESNKRLASQRESLNRTSESWELLNKQIEDNNEVIRGIDTNLIIKQINLEKQLADERAEALKKRVEAQKKASEEAAKQAKEDREKAFADFKAGVELQLLASKEGSEEQLELRKKLLLASLQIDLENEKLTNNQRRLLIQQYYKDRTQLEKNFQSDRTKLILENIASDIQAELQTLELAGERKLELTETAINLSAELEIEAANKNAAKIAEIIAKRDKAIRDARRASLQENLDFELKTVEVANAATVRALNRRLADEKTTTEDRIRIIDELSEIESAAIQKRIDALNEERKKGLISQKEYNLQYDILVDEQNKIWEDAEAKKTEITKKASEERRQKAIEEIQTIASATAEVIDVLDSLFQIQSSRENENIERQKKELKDLQEAGAITEKEAITRQKRIEAEEKRIRQQQAQRDKQIAVFKALLAIPQAALQGLSQGGPILAAIYGALAAAQAAIVIARPIPKFSKGKKDSYEGPGVVAETGTELVEKDGRMYVVDKPQVVWLGKKDKVFNPQETEKMLSKSAMNTERPALTIEKKPFSIDYKKLGKEVGKHTSTTVYVDGYREQQIRKESFIRDLNKRRSW